MNPRPSHRRCLPGVLTLAVMILISGCATHVVPPVNPPHPTAIYLCDYGFHSSLLLPTGGGQFVEYVYGDWDYAALNKNNVYHKAEAMFFSPQPALGRRFLQTPPGESYPFPPNQPHDVQKLVVDARKVAAVVDTMDRRYLTHRATALLNDAPLYGFTFVKDSERYNLNSNCNTLSTRNLKAMGCQIEGHATLSNIIVDPPGGRRITPGPYKLGRPSPCD